MRKAFRRNWAPKVVALILATAIWMLIRSNLESEGLWVEQNPPRAGEPSIEEVEQELRELRKKTGELEIYLGEKKKDKEK